MDATAHSQAQLGFAHQGYLLDGSLYRGVRGLGLFQKLEDLLESLLVWFPIALHLSSAPLSGLLQWQQTDRHALGLIRLCPSFATDSKCEKAC